MTTQEERERNASTDNIRRVLAEGFAFVRGNEVTEGVSASTFEHTLVRAINNIETDESEIRPSLLSSIRAMRQRVVDAVAQARKMPASSFNLSSDSAQTANTREDGSGPELSEDG